MFVQLSDEKFSEYKAFRDRGRFIHKVDWKIWEEKKEFKVYFIDEKNSLRSIKSETIINKPLKQVYDFVANLENKIKYDKNFDSGYIIKSINENYNLQYQKYRGKLGVSPRDFTLIVKRVYVKVY